MIEKESNFESHLVDGARSGDLAMLNALCMRIMPALRRKVRKYINFMSNNADVEDLVQEVLCLIITRPEVILCKYESSKGSLEGWLARYAHYVCLSYIRRQGRQKRSAVAEVSLDCLLDDMLWDRHANIEEELVRKNQLGILKRQLPKEDWDLLTALVIEQDHEEISRRFQVSANALSKRLQRIRHRCVQLSESSSTPEKISALKVLIAPANRSNETRDATTKEHRKLASRLQQSTDRTDLILIDEPEINLHILNQYIEKHQPQIIHFCGHGSSQSKLILTDGSSEEDITSSGFVKMLHSHATRLVVLDSCYSQKQAPEIARQVDCVVGVKNPMPDAVRFSAAFYEALGYCKNIEAAHKSGACALKGVSNGEIPKLLSAPGVQLNNYVIPI
jgi:RNA polymerase sigma factor (sigma-70 family)